MRLVSLWAAAAPVVAAAVGATPTRAPVNRNGWRSWNAFGLNVDQTLILDVANAVADRRWTTWNGSTVSLADLGYVDVGIDDGWQQAGAGLNGGFHDASGHPIVNTSKFPDMAGLVEGIHSLGLTAGFYGNNCHDAEKDWVLANFVGDVDYFVATGFDGYKLDSCGAQKDIALYSALLTHATTKNITVENVSSAVRQEVNVATLTIRLPLVSILPVPQCEKSCQQNLAIVGALTLPLLCYAGPVAP